MFPNDAPPVQVIPSGAQRIADALIRLPQLTELDVNSTFRGPLGSENLARAIANTPRLTLLDCSNRRFWGIGGLGSALERTPLLRTLNLENTDLDPSSTELLAAGLVYVPGLSVLHVERNKIGPAGARHLAAGLAFTPLLTFLDVSGNNIGDAGLAALADGLRHTPGLTRLDVSRNEQHAAGVTALAEGLRHTPRLTALRINQGCHCSAGVSALAAALQHTPCLAELRMDGVVGFQPGPPLPEPKPGPWTGRGDPDGTAAAAALAAGLRHVAGLTELSVRNGLPPQAVAALLAGLGHTGLRRLHLTHKEGFADLRTKLPARECAEEEAAAAPLVEWLPRATALQELRYSPCGCSCACAQVYLQQGANAHWRVAPRAFLCARAHARTRLRHA